MKINKIQIEFLLKVCQYLLVFIVFWSGFWIFIWETLYWEKDFAFFRNLDEWVELMLSLVLLATIDLLLEHPELLKDVEFKLRMPRVSLRRQKKKPEEEEKQGTPFW